MVFSDSSRGHSLWFQYRDIGEPTLISDESADHAHFEVTTHSLAPDKYAHYSTNHFSIHLKRKHSQNAGPPHPWHTTASNASAHRKTGASRPRSLELIDSP